MIVKYKTQRNTGSKANLKWRLNLSVAGRGKKKPMSKEHKEKIRQSCLGINKGRKRPDLVLYNKKRKGIFKHEEETKQKIRKTTKETWSDVELRNKQSQTLKKVWQNENLRQWRSALSTGKNNPAYINGMGKEPYPMEFNISFKNKIRKKYNYTCQLCGVKELELKGWYKKHAPHHINYTPKDMREINFILLCHQCNKKVNWNRDYWFAYFCYLKRIEPEDLITWGIK